MKKIAYLLVVAAVLCAIPAFAQGPFNDVPTDHWAYDAVNQLQKSGIVIGYPDGTFGGKRAMSRYEFAVAIARIMPLINPNMPTGLVTNAELNAALKDYAKKSELPDFAKFATKADVDAIRKLVDEFKDELAALGVDVDALKRDVAALDARVCAIEAEQRRVRFTGDVNVFAITSSSNEGTVIDLDNRVTPEDATFIRNIGVVKDFDLNVVGRVSDSTTAVATINYGNYLNYLGYVDDYYGGVRPTSKSGAGYISGYQAAYGEAGYGQGTLSDNFFPYYLYITTGFCGGNITVGRFPIQWTPYTLKKIDVDSYTSILKTDDGNYPMDGVKLATGIGGVDLTLFAAKNDQNDYLVNGLTGQPTAGAYDVYGVFNDAGGHSVGGLDGLITQSAGARAVLGTPFKGTLGLSFYQAWSANTVESPWDQARVYGADLAIPFGNINFQGSWTRSDTLVADGITGVDDINNDNTAWDASLATTFGTLGVDAGYKRIEYNFAAAGFWDKIGRWTNPTDIKGPYVDVKYPFGSKVSFIANAEFLSTVSSDYMDITKVEAGLKWGLSKANSVDLGVQWVQWDPQGTAEEKANEQYYTVGWAHQINPNAGFKIGYQFINSDDDSEVIYGNYKGSVGVVQFGVSF